MSKVLERACIGDLAAGDGARGTSAASVDAAAQARWRMGFHLMPPTGWLNDPNGLCWYRGVYHVFHQYSPDWPRQDAPRGWGHATSRDLVHWEHHGMVIRPDIPEDASGSYSGSAVVLPGAAKDGGDQLRLYYTGNVKEPGDHDYIHTGRQANEILVTSDDGQAFSPKRVLMRNSDYPSACSLHVRDPKVWLQEGRWWMVLGARDRDDLGMVLIYRSQDGLTWEHHVVVRPTGDFGYMWECPDRVCLDGHEYLSFCPQGMEGYAWSSGMRDQSGYLPIEEGGRLIDVCEVDPAGFERWDKGFDFYAPQTFVDDAGRTLLIGWMGMPVAPYESAPQGLSWCHCLTVPRVLGRAEDGRLTQLPAPELESLRGAGVPLAAGSVAAPGGRRADISIEGIDGDISLMLDDVLEVRCERGRLSLSFTGDDASAIGAGRTSRHCSVGGLRDLRVLVDASAVEVYANGGRDVLSTPWFPVAEELSVALRGSCAAGHVWAMGDGMAGTY